MKKNPEIKRHLKFFSSSLEHYHTQEYSCHIPVSAIADRTDCGTLGVGDKVSCLPFRSGVVCGTVGGTAQSPVSSSSVRRSLSTGTATFVLGFSGEFGGALCGGFIGSLISSPS